MSMTIAQAKSELMQIYGMLSPDKQRAIDTLVKIEPCEDAISRDELLKAIDTWDKFGCDANTKLVPYQDHYVPYIHYDDVIKCIKGMPPVNPQEPKIGHWIKKTVSPYEAYRCSECNSAGCDWYKFCPSCGAKMESEVRNEVNKS